MKIATKLNLYDDIFFIHNKKAIKSTVKGIKIEISSNNIEHNIDVIYLCGVSDDHKLVAIKCDEIDAFKTKEELIKSL